MSNYIKQIELVQDGSHNIIDIGTPHLIETTWEELVSLKSNHKLIKGTWYRITDYNYGDAAFGGKHQFDILTLAISDRKLSEECRAMNHGDDITSADYFNNSNLQAWKIWYSLENNSKYIGYLPNGHGMIYRMIDEFGNDCPYDFKNVLIQKVENSVTKNYYTFDNNGRDHSLNGGAKNNIIKPYINDGQYQLNNIVIKAPTDVCNNIFDNGCHDITLGLAGGNINSIMNNSFGANSHTITFGGNCKNNIVGNECHDIILGDANECIFIDNSVNYITFNPVNSIKHVHVHSDVHGSETSTLVLSVNINQKGQTNFNMNTGGTDVVKWLA